MKYFHLHLYITTYTQHHFIKDSTAFLGKTRPTLPLIGIIPPTLPRKAAGSILTHLHIIKICLGIPDLYSILYNPKLGFAQH